MAQVLTKVWIVFLMDACGKVGLNPIEKRVFHRLIYLSNCLAPLFEATPTAAHIVKYKRGPFYPVIQWELDRLAVAGVLNVRGVEYRPDSHGDWMEAKYAANERTAGVVKNCCEIPYGVKLRSYLSDVVLGFASLNHIRWEDIALKDRTYDAPGVKNGALIDVTADDRNFSVASARKFRQVLPEGISTTPREELFLYLRLLEELAKPKAA